jgi:hypothetical protein
MLPRATVPPESEGGTGDWQWAQPPRLPGASAHVLPPPTDIVSSRVSALIGPPTRSFVNLAEAGEGSGGTMPQLRSPPWVERGRRDNLQQLSAESPSGLPVGPMKLIPGPAHCFICFFADVAPGRPRSCWVDFPLPLRASVLHCSTVPCEPIDSRAPDSSPQTLVARLGPEDRSGSSHATGPDRLALTRPRWRSSWIAEGRIRKESALSKPTYCFKCS